MSETKSLLERIVYQVVFHLTGAVLYTLAFAFLYLLAKLLLGI